MKSMLSDLKTYETTCLMANMRIWDFIEAAVFSSSITNDELADFFAFKGFETFFRNICYLYKINTNHQDQLLQHHVVVIDKRTSAKTIGEKR